MPLFPPSLFGVSLSPVTATACASFALLLICGCGEDRPSEAGPSAQLPTPALDGVYRVSGTTVEVDSGISRELSGLFVLRQEGKRYSTSFELSTDFRQGNKGEGRSAEIIGEGTGRVDGDTLVGTAETQLVLASVPGVHAKFALIPRILGPRIVSSTVAQQLADGTLSVEIESEPGEGEEYLRTRTSLVGQRVGDVGSAPALPDVAAAPKETSHPSQR